MLVKKKFNYIFDNDFESNSKSMLTNEKLSNEVAFFFHENKKGKKERGFFKLKNLEKNFLRVLKEKVEKFNNKKSGEACNLRSAEGEIYYREFKCVEEEFGLFENKDFSLKGLLKSKIEKYDLSDLNLNKKLIVKFEEWSKFKSSVEIKALDKYIKNKAYFTWVKLDKARIEEKRFLSTKISSKNLKLKILKKMSNIVGSLTIEEKWVYVYYYLIKHYRRLISQKYLKRDYSEEKRSLRKEEGYKPKLAEKIELWFNWYYRGLWTQDDVINNVTYRFDEIYWKTLFYKRMKNYEYVIKFDRNRLECGLSLRNLSKLYMYLLEESNYLNFYWGLGKYKRNYYKNWKRSISREWVLNKIETLFKFYERMYLKLKGKNVEEDETFYLDMLNRQERWREKDWIKKEEYISEDLENDLDNEKIRNRVQHFYKLDEIVLKDKEKRDEDSWNERQALLEKTYKASLMKKYMNNWLKLFEKKKEKYEKALMKDLGLIDALLKVKEEKCEISDKFLKFMDLKQKILIKFECFSFIHYIETKGKLQKVFLNSVFVKNVLNTIEDLVKLRLKKETDWFFEAKDEANLKPYIGYKQVWREALLLEKKIKKKK